MLIKVKNPSHGGNHPLSLRCPGCRQIGTFEAIPNIQDMRTGDTWLGQRRCPNLECRTHVFCVYSNTGEILSSYPPQRIDFDTKGIPAPIVKSLQEAIACDAENLHVASAIMIRRTLEELCEDKAAEGANLKMRLASLQSVVVLPKGLLLALDDLRLLGNDAAHIEAKTYDSIGKEELSIAIELTKEILKAVYQLDELLGRLRALKKS